MQQCDKTRGSTCNKARMIGTSQIMIVALSQETKTGTVRNYCLCGSDLSLTFSDRLTGRVWGNNRNPVVFHRNILFHVLHWLALVHYLRFVPSCVLNVSPKRRTVGAQVALSSPWMKSYFSFRKLFYSLVLDDHFVVATKQQMRRETMAVH